jgi:hypothetical protein
MNVRISYYPKCSSQCKTTCEPCKLDCDGELTGREWFNEKTGEKLVEIQYKKEEKTLSDVIPEKYIAKK